MVSALATCSDFMGRAGIGFVNGIIALVAKAGHRSTTVQAIWSGHPPT